MLSSALAAVAGYTDWRSRRVPNWLTVPGLVAGVAANSWAAGWAGARTSLLGASLGLALLLPFVLIRALGAGDFKLAGALGAFLGPARLLDVLFAAILVAGVMAAVLIVWKGRARQTLRNLWHMMAALLTLHMPGSEVSLDNPQALKVPFGVAMAIAAILYTAGQAWGRL